MFIPIAFLFWGGLILIVLLKWHYMGKAKWEALDEVEQDHRAVCRTRHGDFCKKQECRDAVQAIKTKKALTYWSPKKEKASKQEARAERGRNWRRVVREHDKWE